MSKSSVANILVSYHDVSQNMGLLPSLGSQRLATVPACGPCLLLLRKAATKVVRPRSNQGLRYTYEDRSEEAEDRALIPAITSLATVKTIPQQKSRETRLLLFVQESDFARLQ